MERLPVRQLGRSNRAVARSVCVSVVSVGLDRRHPLFGRGRRARDLGGGRSGDGHSIGAQTRYARRTCHEIAARRALEYRAVTESG
jgi:hypothetical protein